MADIATTKNTKHSKKDYVFAVGRRREAVARIRLFAHVPTDLAWDDTAVKKGDMLVNAMPIADYFSGDTARHTYSEPFRVTNTANKYTLTIRVTGGGKAGQLDAVVIGVSRALASIDPEMRDTLKKKGFLTRDARIRERRKVGTGGKARRTKQSPKR